MSDFAPNYTPRYKIRYVAAGVVHTMQFRVARGTGATAITTAGGAAAQALATAMQSTLPDDFEWTDATYALEDSDIFLPAGGLPSDPTGAVDPDTLTPIRKIVATTFSARSEGSKTRVSLFCPAWSPDTLGDVASDGIVRGGEISAVANAVSALNAADLVGGDGLPAVFYNYATVKVSDALLRLVRRGLIT